MQANAHKVNREQASHYTYNWRIISTLHTHAHTRPYIPSRRWVVSLYPPYPPPTEACCSDNCSPKLMTSPGALVCVYVCVNNSKRCISLTTTEQELHIDIKWKRSQEKEKGEESGGVAHERRDPITVIGVRKTGRKGENLGYKKGRTAQEVQRKMGITLNGRSMRERRLPTSQWSSQANPPPISFGLNGR